MLSGGDLNWYYDGQQLALVTIQLPPSFKTNHSKECSVTCIAIVIRHIEAAQSSFNPSIINEYEEIDGRRAGEELVLTKHPCFPMLLQYLCPDHDHQQAARGR